MASSNERKQLEEDIERIKSALQSSGGDWNPAESGGPDSEDDEEDGDALHIITNDKTWETGVASDDGSISASSKASEGSKHKKKSSAMSPRRPPVADFTDSVGAHQEQTEVALALNRAYQEIISENLDSIQLMLTQNKEHQEEMQERLSKQMDERGKSTSTAKKNLSHYGMPYFRDLYGNPPPYNADTLAKRESGFSHGYIKNSRIWTVKDKDCLMEAIKTECLKQKMRPLINKIELEQEKIENCKHLDEIVEVNDRITLLRNELAKIKNGPDLVGERARDDMRNIDWMKISTVDFDGQKSVEELQVYWRNALHPSINTGRWKREEDTRLQELVEFHGGRDWETIAEELETNRTGFQCIQRFQTKLNPCLQTGKWMAEEDDFLKLVVETVTVENIIPWDKVAYYIEGRTREQCEQRWNILNLSSKKGRWTPEEDKLLLAGIERYGKLWIKVAKLVPSRSHAQCRERYMNSLDRNKKGGFWSYEEDKKLWLLYEKYGQNQWAAIANELEGRTDNACLQRYQVLHRLKHIEDILMTCPGGQTLINNLLSVGHHKLPQSLSNEENTSRRIQKIKTIKENLQRNKKNLLKCLQRQSSLSFSISSRPAMNIHHYQTKLDEIKEKEEVLAKSLKTIKERQHHEENEEDDDAVPMILADRANGIYVPRPLLGQRCIRTHLFRPGKEELLKSTIEKRVRALGSQPENNTLKGYKIGNRGKHKKKSTREEDLCDDGDDDDNQIDEQNGDEETDEEDIVPRPSKPSQLKAEPNPELMSFSNANTTRRNKMLSEKKIRNTKSRRGKKIRGHPSNREEMLDNSLADLVQNSWSTRRTGRPKMLYVDSGEEAIKDVDSKVIKLLCSALNMDVEGCAKKGTKMVQEQMIDLRKSRQFYLSRYDPKDNILQNYTDLKAFQDALGKDLGIPDEWSAQSLGSKETSVPLQMMPRRALEGDMAGKAYNLPPLPPTVSSIKGFKNILLNRQDLVCSSKKKIKLTPSPAKNQKKSAKSSSSIQATSEMTNGVIYTDQSSEITDDCLRQNLNVSERKETNQENKEAVEDGTVAMDTADNQAAASGSVNVDAESVANGSHSQTVAEEMPVSSSGNSDEVSMSKPQPRILLVKGANVQNQEDINKLLQDQGLINTEDGASLQVLTKDGLKKLSQDAEKASISLNTTKGNNKKKAMDILRKTHDYQMVRARFRSLFLWPALLSTMAPGDPVQIPESRSNPSQSQILQTPTKPKQALNSSSDQSMVLDQVDGPMPEQRRKRSRTVSSELTELEPGEIRIEETEKPNQLVNEIADDPVIVDDDESTHSVCDSVTVVTLEDTVDPVPVMVVESATKKVVQLPRDGSDVVSISSSNSGAGEEAPNPPQNISTDTPKPNKKSVKRKRSNKSLGTSVSPVAVTSGGSTANMELEPGEVLLDKETMEEIVPYVTPRAPASKPVNEEDIMVISSSDSEGGDNPKIQEPSSPGYAMRDDPEPLIVDEASENLSTKPKKKYPCTKGRRFRNRTSRSIEHKKRIGQNHKLGAEKAKLTKKAKAVNVQPVQSVQPSEVQPVQPSDKKETSTSQQPVSSQISPPVKINKAPVIVRSEIVNLNQDPEDDEGFHMRKVSKISLDMRVAAKMVPFQRVDLSGAKKDG